MSAGPPAGSDAVPSSPPSPSRSSPSQPPPRSAERAAGSPLLAERFAARAAAAPDAVALRDAAGETTYAALAARVERAARALAGSGRVALLPRSDAASLVTVLGAMRAGTSVVLLHRHLTPPQVAHALEVARPTAVVAPDASRISALLRQQDRTPPVVTDVEELDGGGALPPLAGTAELLVGLTSGTSGEPKLFVRDQASWAATLDRSDAAFDVRPGERVAAPGPLDHTHFLYGALHALTRGATADLRPLSPQFADGGPVEHAYLVPALAHDLVEALGGAARPDVRGIASSAAPWPDGARERLARLLPRARVAHFYGASELSFVTLDGRPFPGVEVEIRDDAGRALRDGEQGEVHVRSDMLFAGYLTAGGLAGGPDGDGWFTVGDLGTLRDGRLALAGRASDTIVSGGLNVEPAEVELALAALPGIAEAACVALPDERLGAIPVAVLVAAPPAAAALPAFAAPPAPVAPPPPPPAAGAPAPPLLTRAAVRAHVGATLPQPSRPRRIFVADALPRTPRGKLDRPALVARIAAGALRELA